MIIVGIYQNKWKVVQGVRYSWKTAKNENMSTLKNLSFVNNIFLMFFNLKQFLPLKVQALI